MLAHLQLIAIKPTVTALFCKLTAFFLQFAPIHMYGFCSGGSFESFPSSRSRYRNGYRKAVERNHKTLCKAKKEEISLLNFQDSFECRTSKIKDLRSVDLLKVASSEKPCFNPSVCKFLLTSSKILNVTKQFYSASSKSWKYPQFREAQKAKLVHDLQKYLTLNGSTSIVQLTTNTTTRT